MEFYFRFIGIMTAGGAFTLKQETVSALPIKISNSKIQNRFISLVDYILFCKQQNKDTIQFEKILDVMVYELYFAKEIKAANCGVIEKIDELPKLKEEWSDKKKLEVIETIYKELSDLKHPVSIAMAKMQEIEEVKIIEGRI
jgi:hypothetical protein